MVTFENICSRDPHNNVPVNYHANRYFNAGRDQPSATFPPNMCSRYRGMSLFPSFLLPLFLSSPILLFPYSPPSLFLSTPLATEMVLIFSFRFVPYHLPPRPLHDMPSQAPEPKLRSGSADNVDADVCAYNWIHHNTMRR